MFGAGGKFSHTDTEHNGNDGKALHHKLHVLPLATMLFVFIYSFFHALMHSTLPHCFAFVFFFFCCVAFCLLLSLLASIHVEQENRTTLPPSTAEQMQKCCILYCFFVSTSTGAGFVGSATAAQQRSTEHNAAQRMHLFTWQ